MVVLTDFSGVGNDPKNRHFRTVSQGMTYDPQGEFVKMWIPKLGGLPPEQAHAPWTAPVTAGGEDDNDNGCQQQEHQEEQHQEEQEQEQEQEAAVGQEGMMPMMPVPMVAVATQMKYVPQPAAR